MKALSIDTAPTSIPISGLGLGLVAVVMFSGTVPATRIAVQTIDPVVVGVGRSVLGALLATGYLVAVRASWPSRAQWPGIAVIAAGAAVGFGWFSAQALRTVSASHGSVVVGVLPVLTAVFGTLRTGARPRPLFWIATAAGSAVVVVYAALSSRSASIGLGDSYLFAALVCAAAAYAEGGRLAKTMPGGQVIAWGLVAALPVSLPLSAMALRSSPFAPSPASLTALVYMAIFSVFVGMVLWYRAMGVAGVPRVSSIQLVQPLMSVFWSWVLIGEPLQANTIAAAILVLLCVATAQRARISTVTAGAANPHLTPG
ncbi:MAG TPA: DMT family transporter [Candidatus Dormibacteraeota bacterium]|nr:DMT family transporter [Candidatus Dormibacteraeota bacterium]